MRAWQLMENDYQDQLRDEIIGLLTSVSAEGFDSVSTMSLLADLESQGYSVDEESLLMVLGDIEIVSSATSDKIELSTSDADMMVGTDADAVSGDQVDRLATKQATDDLGDDL